MRTDLQSHPFSMRQIWSVIVLLLANLLLTMQVFAQTYPPACVVTMPYSNAYFKAGTDVEIHVYATDIGKSTNNGTVTRVEFFHGNTKLGETSRHTDNTYTFTWNCVPAGEYRITARATNNRGVSFTSVGVLITVGNQEVVQRGLSACKGKYMAGLHQNGLQGPFTEYFNGATAENACKWGSVEGTRNRFNWSGADLSYNDAINRQMMFRYHAAVWASQYPSWLFTLTTAEARVEVIEYMEAIAQRYPRTDQIDVLNEQLFTHQRDNQRLRDLLSGKSNTAIDDFSWQIWLFTEARRIFPNTKLVLNDYGLEGSTRNIDEMLKLVRVLRDRGLIDGFGTQAHWFSVDRHAAGRIKQDCDHMARGGVPVYVTELDMNGNIEDYNTNEQAQLNSFRIHFTEFWEHPAVKGITWWGHMVNRTWVTGTGFINQNGTPRAAGRWLIDYMNGRTSVGYPICATAACAGRPTVQITSPANDAAFVAPASINLAATASTSSGTITHVRFFNGNTLLHTDNTAPYTYAWTNVAAGTYWIRAVVTNSLGNTAVDSVWIRVNVPQAPYGGKAHIIPGTIQLEHFDLGGNGFAYYDDSPGSQVTPVVNFRTDEDVDIENCTDIGGGYNIGWATAGEWLEYTVDVTKPGTYDLALRVACNGTGRTLSVSMDGRDIAADVAIPNTTGWQVWQTVTVKDIELSMGQKVMRVTIGATDFINMNYATFTLTKELKQEPFLGTPHKVPGRIQAEHYDLGGQGLGYHEAERNGNLGGATIRNDEVDIEPTLDEGGGYNIGYILRGEWLAYTVEVATNGTYDLDLRMAADGAGKTLHIEIDGKDVTGPIQVPNTGGWQTWQTVKVEGIDLKAGEHVMRVVFRSDYMNLNWLEFKDVITSVATHDLKAVQLAPNPFNDQGILIRKEGAFLYRITDMSGSEMEQGAGSDVQEAGKNLNSGIYIIHIESGTATSTHKIIKL